MSAETGVRPPVRSRTRKAADTFSAYLRLDAIEEAMFPLGNAFRYVALIAPVFTYYFQAEFLGARALYTSTLVGISTAAGMQFALTGFTVRLQWAQERGTLESYLVEPVSWRLIPLAMNVWPSLIGLLITCAMLSTGWLLGAEINVSGLPMFLVVLALGLAACNAVGVLSASYLVLFKRGEPILAAYGLAASLLGGALFSIDVLPWWLRWMSYLVPHAYAIGAERALLAPGTPNGGISVRLAVVVLVVFSVAGLWLGLRAFAAALQYARRLGILSS